MARGLLSLLFTGAVVELALIPISAFHFHRAGVYGSVANIIAIPLTTFVTMPFEALALVFDEIGAGWPFWWVTARSLDLLLWIAHSVAALPGAVASIPAMPTGAYALMVVGGLWIALWRTRWRRIGAVPLAIGATWALLTPCPGFAGNQRWSTCCYSHSRRAMSPCCATELATTPQTPLPRMVVSSACRCCCPSNPMRGAAGTCASFSAAAAVGAGAFWRHEAATSFQPNNSCRYARPSISSLAIVTCHVPAAHAGSSSTR